MGEKRAYKARKSGDGRTKLKSEYDAGKNKMAIEKYYPKIIVQESEQKYYEAHNVFS